MISEPTTLPRAPEAGQIPQNGSKPYVSTGPKPIFVLGTPFSGSSIVSWALAQHENISHVLDTSWLARFSTDLATIFEVATEDASTSQLTALSLDRAEFMESFGEAVNRVFLAPRGRADVDMRSRWVDCTYGHAFHVAELMRLFPQARLIHTVFDVRAVVATLVAQPALSKQTHTVQSAVELWLRTTRSCLEAEMAYGSERVMRLHYRELLRNPDAVMRRCLAFLDETYDDACLRPFIGLTDPLSTVGDGGAADPGDGLEIPEDAQLLSDLLAFDTVQHHEPDPERIAGLDAKAQRAAAPVAPVMTVETPTSLGGKVRQAAAEVIPANATALVISKGDEDLVHLNGIKATHFPQDGSGRYSGYHPASSAEAITQLEQARASGGDYLIVPSPYAWWLDYYSEFRDHLMSSYRLVYLHEDSCSIFSLMQQAEDDNSIAAKLFRRTAA